MRSPVLSEDETVEYVARFTIGASGLHTKTTGFPGKGITGVARTAAGQYRIDFARGVPVGGVVNASIQHWPANLTTAALNCAPITYAAETAAAVATLTYQAFDGGTPTQTELPSGTTVTIRVRFLKTK